MTCHGSYNLKERKSNRDGVRLFTCTICGEKWSYTNRYYKQGRKPLPEGERKSVVFPVRVTKGDHVDIKSGKKRVEIVEVTE